jgi:chromosome segregation ATPase
LILGAFLVVLLGMLSSPPATHAGDSADQKKQIEQLKQALEAKERQLEEQKKQSQDKEALLLKKLAELQQQLDAFKKEQEVIRLKEAAEKQALQEQIKKALKQAKDDVEMRDKLNLKLEQEKDKYFNQLKRAEETQQILLSRMQELQKLLKNVPLPQPDPKKDPKAKPTGNPPPFYIKGKITKVDPKDDTLVTISLGKDQGIVVGHTLEVFRTLPQAKYLGIIRIIDVSNHSAVGRLQPMGNGAAPTLKEGDQVTSQLLPGN